MIGVGGDADNKDMPPFGDAGSVGVFGQGADAKVKAIVADDGSTVFDGPAEPGAGVIGRGGIATGPRPGTAAGVIGLAGGQTKPGLSETGSTGVFGLGPTGVRGIGVSDATTPSGPGVSGFSDKNRGGIFASQEEAQIQLTPRRVRTKLPPADPVTPTAIPLGALREGAVSLPKNGEAGDLMTLLDDARLCTLWFCLKGEDASGPAQWAQVLLGPSFPGRS